MSKPIKSDKRSVPVDVCSSKMLCLCYMQKLSSEYAETRIKMHKSEIDNLKRKFPERSTEFLVSLILFCDWFIV